MLIIGEKINTTRKGMEQAVRDRNADVIREEAVRQARAGAHILDVNCGTLPTEAEPEALSWLVQTVQSAVDSAVVRRQSQPCGPGRGSGRAPGQADDQFDQRREGTIRRRVTPREAVPGLCGGPGHG